MVRKPRFFAIAISERPTPEFGPLQIPRPGDRGVRLLRCCGHDAYRWLRSSFRQSESGAAVACLDVRCWSKLRRGARESWRLLLTLSGRRLCSAQSRW
jgi:hypothetical protein